ncbi:MAG: hypothetical protein KIT83_07205 [Bryobacterales bacterium]|nr:hypothetical protein [Bryobacterales bacterium]
MTLRSIYVAFAALALVVLYHLLLIAGHQRNVTALFYAGDRTPAPPALRGSIFQFPDSVGFDGQYYLYLAQDPLNLQGTAAFIDNPAMRWKRILFPGLAHLMALGQPAAVPIAYIVLMWLSALLGALLLSRLCALWSYPSWLGMSFLVIPAATVSLDRMMTDIGIVVALLALLLALREDRPALAIAAIALAPLARETGIVLAAAWIAWHTARRDWRRTAWGICAVVPFAAWTAWVHFQFGPDLTLWWGWPFEGILTRLASYAIYPAPLLGLKLALLLDYVGALGVAASFVITFMLLLRGERSVLLVMAAIYTLGISVFAREDMWGEAYSYTRTGGPVALMLAFAGLEQRRWWLLAPMCLAIPRILFQLLLAILDSVRGMGG